MNLINLLGNTVWTDREITEHTEALVHQVTPVMEEMVLNRKLTAAAMGQWVMTEQEQAELAAYSQACLAAHQVGIEMRRDNWALINVLKYEAARDRLDQPVCDEDPMITVTNEDGSTSEVLNPVVQQDETERAYAQDVCENVTEDTFELYDLRHPPEPDPLPEPV